MKKIDLPIEEIVKKYNEYMSQQKLAKIYGVSPMTISNRIREYYGRPIYISHKISFPIMEIVKQYEAGMTEQDIAKQYGLARQTISKKLVAYYKKTGKPKPQRITEKIELPIQEIARKYEQGISQHKLAKEYGIAQNTISKRLAKYYKKIGKPMPDRRPKQSIPSIALPIDEIIKEYEQHISQAKLAQKYNVSVPTLRKRIREYYQKAGLQQPQKIKQKIELPIEELIFKYEQGITYSKMADEYGVSIPTISRNIDNYYQQLNITKPIKVPTETNVRKKIPVAEIVAKYEQGINKSILANEYGVSSTTISKRIKEYLDQTGQTELPLKKDISIEAIIKKYEAGIYASIIAQEYDTSESTISKMINEYYTAKGLPKPRLLRNVTTIVDYLNKGLTIEQIKESAGKKNIIIPQSIIDTALDKIKNKDLSDDDDAR